MERFKVKKRKSFDANSNQFEVIDTQTNTVVSDHFYRSAANDKALDLNLSDPNHPKHWLHLATTTGERAPGFFK